MSETSKSISQSISSYQAICPSFCQPISQTLNQTICNNLQQSDNRPSATIRQHLSNLGVSENSVPLNPMVLLIIIPSLKMAISLGILTQHFQTNPSAVRQWHNLQVYCSVPSFVGLMLMPRSSYSFGTGGRIVESCTRRVAIRRCEGHH